MNILKEILTQVKKDDQMDILEEGVELTHIELIEAELDSVIQEMAVERPHTDKYKSMVDNLETLARAYEHQAKALAELNKAEEESWARKNRNRVDWGAVGPKIAGIVVYGAVTVMFMAIEREHPPAMRLVQAANTLINPKV